MATEPRWSVPRGAWVLLPLLAGLLYAGGHALLRRSPGLRDLVPPDAIETQRFRDLSALDALTASDGPPTSALLGARLNLPGLPGVDRGRPLLVALLAPGEAPTSELFVLPVSDADAVERAFADPGLAERHAAYLEVRGDHALAGADGGAVRRRRPRGDLWPDELGEDWARLVDWPRFLDHVFDRRTEGPFRLALEAIGVDVARLAAAPGSAPQEPVSFGRLPIVRDAWGRASLHGWADRVRATLVPTEGGALAQALSEAVRASPEPPPALPPPYADGPSLLVHGARGRRALALALRDAGVWFPPSVSLDSFRLDVPGSLTLWAESSRGDAWTIALAAPPAAQPNLAGFGLPEKGGPVPLPAGAVALAAPFGGEAPAGTLARGVTRDGALALVALGPDGARAAATGAATLGAPSEVPAGAEGTTVLAWLRVPQAFAARLLGPALEPGGLLSPLRGGDVEGTLSTDGSRLILDLRRR